MVDSVSYLFVIFFIVSDITQKVNYKKMYVFTKFIKTKSLVRIIYVK